MIWPTHLPPSEDTHIYLKGRKEFAMNMGVWIAIGIGIGTGIGVMMDNIGAGIGIGAALGAALGLAVRDLKGSDD